MINLRTFKYWLTGLCCIWSLTAAAGELVWFDGRSPVTYTLDRKADVVVKTALSLFSEDMRQVTGMPAMPSRKGKIKIVQRRGSDDGFRIYVRKKQIVVEGHNARGTAYGILELSRMAGVSPWVWWGDVVPERKDKLAIDSDFKSEHVPSVAYRGIFINDEDWSTRPWSQAQKAGSQQGSITTETYKRIFQLLLRLRANAIWPGMHPGTTAFFRIPGAKATADSFGIVIGSSHCEPLLRNNVDEWDANVRGRFNYRTNRQAVTDYWTERLIEVSASSNNMFTIGMRGIHDSSMEGYNTEQEKFDALQQVIDDQQRLLRQYIGDPERQTQVFVPYKEVLQLYEKGLKVPGYVTLMWCDDNYGYMTRLSDTREQQRPGGGGVYYHLSYWGRPHDYLWLTTTQPGLIYHQMRQAYDHHVREIWIANVHDPKVAGYDLELFLDMAWDIQCVSGDTLGRHYLKWLCRQFGQSAGEKLYPAMTAFYRLCGERKPEFMGWNQVELDKKKYARGISPVTDTEFSTGAFGGELDRYLEQYGDIVATVEEAGEMIRPELADAYFAAIRYPVMAAASHATRLLEAQKARQTGDSLSVALSLTANEEVRQLTAYYNDTLAGGKWRGLMSCRPRELPVFDEPPLPYMLTKAETEEVFSRPRLIHPPHTIVTDNGVIARNASRYDHSSGQPRIIQMLGHSMSAVTLSRGESLTYRFEAFADGDYVLTTALIPTQPNDNGDLRYSVSIDQQEPVVYSLKEPFRSEQWKLNVLRGQARRTLDTHLSKGSHTLTIKAIDDNIVVDQWMVDPQKDRHFYLIPTE